MVNPGEKKEPLKIYADNKESYFQASYIAIMNTDADTDESHNLGDVILLKNITEFKELDTAKTTFISTISHELKTPISAILMSLQLLEDNRVGALNEEQEQLSKSIREKACILPKNVVSLHRQSKEQPFVPCSGLLLRPRWSHFR